MAITSSLLQIASNGNVQCADKDNMTWCREAANKMKLKQLTLTVKLYLIKILIKAF